MRIKTINRAALIISGGSAVVVFGVLYVLSGLTLALTVALVALGVSYGLCRLLIHKYVIQRIKPMYQVVFSENIRTKVLEEKLEDKDIIDTMSDNLEQWAKTKTTEIVRLKEMERYRKDFLGNVSHELKTPLFTLQGYILTLLDGGLHDERINLRYLQQSEKNLDRLIAIVKDLEQISKLEAGELKLSKEPFDIVAMTREVVEILQYNARESRITFKIQNSLPIEVFADKEHIERVLMNLALNSIRYGREGGVTHIRFIDMFDRVLIEVEDNGVGIATDNLPRIFERFYRVDKSRSREQGGTGLGLAISKHIIEGHGETITVRSKLGEGSTFGFTLRKQ